MDLAMLIRCQRMPAEIQHEICRYVIDDELFRIKLDRSRTALSSPTQCKFTLVLDKPRPDFKIALSYILESIGPVATLKYLLQLKRIRAFEDEISDLLGGDGVVTFTIDICGLEMITLEKQVVRNLIDAIDIWMEEEVIQVKEPKDPQTFGTFFTRVIPHLESLPNLYHLVICVATDRYGDYDARMQGLKELVRWSKRLNEPKAGQAEEKPVLYYFRVDLEHCEADWMFHDEKGCYHRYNMLEIEEIDGKVLLEEPW